MMIDCKGDPLHSPRGWYGYAFLCDIASVESRDRAVQHSPLLRNRDAGYASSRHLADRHLE